MTWYAKGFSGAAELRGQLSVIETVQQGLEIIDRSIDELASGYEPEPSYRVA
jgi:tRNA-dihydrouridine synthase B